MDEYSGLNEIQRMMVMNAPQAHDDKTVVIDTDAHFIIDVVARTIKNQSGKTEFVQFDHNSERLTFECPRYVDSHDLTLCNKVVVNYFINDVYGEYEIDDLSVKTDAENMIQFSWLVSSNVTQSIGKINFVITFKCIQGDTVTYVWNTKIDTSMSVVKGISNDSTIVYENADILQQWKTELQNAAKVEIDDTLTASGKAADAKKTGDELNKKLDKRQPVGSSGKIMGVNENGEIVAVDPLSLDNTLSKENHAADAKKVGDELLKKIDVQQKSSDAGKVLGIGEDGNVLPTEVLSIDDTLTASGKAADAKAVGDKLEEKINKNQGVINSGKVLGIGEDGNVLPVDQSGGNSSIEIDATLTVQGQAADAKAVGDKIDFLLSDNFNILDYDTYYELEGALNHNINSVTILADEPVQNEIKGYQIFNPKDPYESNGYTPMFEVSEDGRYIESNCGTKESYVMWDLDIKKIAGKSIWIKWIQGSYITSSYNYGLSINLIITNEDDTTTDFTQNWNISPSYKEPKVKRILKCDNIPTGIKHARLKFIFNNGTISGSSIFCFEDVFVFDASHTDAPEWEPYTNGAITPCLERFAPIITNTPLIVKCKNENNTVNAEFTTEELGGMASFESTDELYNIDVNGKKYLGDTIEYRSDGTRKVTIRTTKVVLGASSMELNWEGGVTVSKPVPVYLLRTTSLYVPNAADDNVIGNFYCNGLEKVSTNEIGSKSGQIAMDSYQGSRLHIEISYDGTLDEFKAKMIELYNAGTPIEICTGLPKGLWSEIELTPEYLQKFDQLSLPAAGHTYAKTGMRLLKVGYYRNVQSYIDSKLIGAV